MEDNKIKVYEAIDLQPSTFILEGTENTASPVHLSAAAFTRIPNVSMRKVKGKGGKADTWERIRYIAGCHTIIESEQKRLGFEPHLTTGADEIWLLGGKIFVPTDVEPQKVEFLDQCAMNVSNVDRKPDCTPLIKELTEEQEAKESVEDFFTSANVMDYLKNLAVQDGTGRKYDEERIDNLCSLLLISGFDPSQYTLKFNAICQYALANPKIFLTKVADRHAEIKTVILQGLELGVIGWNGEELTFTDNGRVILTSEEKNENARLEEAVEHLIKGSSYTDVNLLTISIKAKKDTILALQN